MKKNRALLACLLMSVATGCEDSAIARAEQAVRDAQKDPDAAQFRNTRKCPTGFYVTGEVNGKNSYGAYTGFKTFYANSAETHIVGETEYADEEGYSKMCYDKAYYDAEMVKLSKEAEEAVANSSSNSLH